MPDLDITPVYKLASGLQGFRVCFGLDRFAGCYAIISINEVSPIGRVSSSLPRDNGREEWNWRREPCRNRMEPACLRWETDRKLLMGKVIIKAQGFFRNIRILIDGFIYVEGTSRALPPSRQTCRSLYPKKAVGSCFGIRGPNSKARARAFRCIPPSAAWPAMIGRLDGRRSTFSQSVTIETGHNSAERILAPSFLNHSQYPTVRRP